MIQYTANDIVEKALALADLQNSDFLSWKEKIQYLNDSYVSMYNKAIDYGDNIFTEDILIEGEEVELPDDFYQLREVYVLNNNVKTLITPKPLNQSLGALSYEIINNTLHIYGKYNGEAHFTYYIVPQTLVVKQETKEITLDETVSDSAPNIQAQKMGFWKDWYINSYLSANKGELKNISDSSITKSFDWSGYGSNSELATPHFRYFDGMNFISITNMSSSSNKVSVGNIRSLQPYGYFTIDSSHYTFAIWNKKMYLLGNYGSGYGLYSFTISSNALANITLKVSLDDTYSISDEHKATIVYFPYDLDADTAIIFDYKYVKVGVNGTRYEIADYLDKGEEVSFFWLNSLDKTYSDSVLFTTTNNRIFTLNNMFDEPNVIGEVDNEYFILGFSGFDTDTGYGIVCYDSAREKTYMVSAFSDTELTFPNNTYFTMIAYNLAILFCNKQGKDNTALRIELERQENVFYDSLHRDETSFRITNVDSFN